jgi:hypothetical protein
MPPLASWWGCWLKFKLLFKNKDECNAVEPNQAKPSRAKETRLPHVLEAL